MNDCIDILLIEDNMFDAELTTRELKQNNIAKNIVHISTGALAMEFLTATGFFSGRDVKNKPKVILLDLKLGHTSGASVLESIMANENTRHIPIVILSGSKDDADLKKCYALGATNFLIKPIKFSGLTKDVLIPLLSKEVQIL